MTAPKKHPGGIVLPDRGDGLHWLRCAECGREWAENDRGTHVGGSRVCKGASATVVYARGETK